ncbi:8-amino-7-oxononanoate synthase [Hydrogenovibrio marinus]|uniref:8-amino-7-oxononanoate synthase n=1 Tax=Hydrogenovibrio marinus TaxID=28885 RepID=A0A066ZVJ8_HYDMR|nr:8-amino-7-oxononanoate synthase [Hydrogenovibrio marinus]KDN96289.1 8-amino-7-oxononanoate synthase [Hydrogenovibrio marinus]BBN60527.1 8-amino-7-oxononanoate synthase [Hydrogenovibrio marinus]
MSIKSRFQPLLEQRAKEHLYRRRPLATTAQDTAMQINGVQTINFSSNDYLGLANHPALKNVLQETGDLSVGSGAAHLVTGHHLEHHLLEDELADWLGFDRALLFSTGYMANLAVQPALMQKGDWIVSDKLNHASLLDGAQLSSAELKRYAHNDMDALEKRLKQAHKDNIQCLVVTDGVFSMDGDLANLPAIQKLAQKYDAWLLVDDAHGIGVMGSQGKGCFEYFGLQADENTILMGTLGKAFGTSGAFVAGSEVAIEALIQFARPYIYTTAMSPVNAKVTRAALKLVKDADVRRQQLMDNIAFFRKGAEAIGLNLMPSESAIQPILLGDSEVAIAWSDALKQSGCWVSAIRPPTVPKDTARLRITLSASHTHAQIQQLLEALAAIQAKSST